MFSAFIVAVMCLLNVNLFDFSSYAEDSEVTEIYLTANVNGQSQKLSALQNKDGNLFLSSSVLSDITVYKYIAESSKFIHDSSDGTSKYREIWITGEKPQINVVSYQMNLPVIKKTIDLPDVLDYNGEKYFPLAELLPTLNSNATIIDKCLYIEDVPYSMTNIMSEFNISEYMFNMYDDNDFLGLSDTKILAGYSYLFNGLVNFDLKRFVPIGAYIGREESYEEIFTSYLAEDETYFAAINEEEHYIIPAVDYMLGDDADRENAIVEAFDALYDISDKEHDELIKTFTTLDSYTTEYSSIEAISTASKGIDFGLKASAYIELYFNHVTDHYEMIDSVYDIENNQKHGLKLWFNGDEQLKAADTIYSQYNSEKRSEIIKYIAEQIGRLYVNEFKSGLSSGGSLTYAKLGASISKLFFIATDFHVYNVAQKCENLGYYNKLMECGVSKFWIYNNTTNNLSHEAIENARLSAIFTLLSSRSMYQAFLDSEKTYGNNGGIYQRKIDSINEILKKLYLAKNCCLTDSEEYIDEKIEILKDSIDDIEINHYNKNNNLIETQLDNIAEDDLIKYGKYFYSHFDESYCHVYFADLTHNNCKEMIVCERNSINDNNASKTSIYIYSIINETVSSIYETIIESSHASDYGLFWIRYNEEDYLMKYLPYINHGQAIFGAEIFSFKDNTYNNFDEISVSFYVKDGISDDLYNESDEKNKSAEYEKFVSKYLPYSITLSNLFWYTDFRGNTYEGVEKVKYTKSEPSVLFSSVINLINEDKNIPSFYCKNGKVATESTSLNLRSSNDTFSSEIIAEIPKNSNIIILESTLLLSNGGETGEWYLVDYNGTIGYVSADYIQLTEEKVQLTEKQLIAIAQLRYYEGLNALMWEMSSCFEYNIDVTFSESEYRYTLLNNIHTKADWLNHVHALFSSKYDDYYKYDEIININSENGYPIYLEKDNNWYASDLIHRMGALNVDVLYPDKHNIIQLTLSSVNENEIIFNGTINWTDARNGYIYSGSPNENISGFSIIYEDGHWKCGKISSNA